MDLERHRRISKLFLEVCDLVPAEREAVLGRECSADLELRQAVEGLLAQDGTRTGDIFARAEAARFALLNQPTLAAARPDQLLLGILGDFRILREIGRGGMGVVYEALQVSLKRSVALKVLPPGLGLTPHAVIRFQREAQAAAKLHHTHIVPVYAVGEEKGSHYYAMELVDGQSLAAVLQDLKGSEGREPLGAVPAAERSGPSSSPGPTSLSDAASGSRAWFDAIAKVVAEVAEALHYAHGQGVIHRDIKPANLLLSASGRLCVADFGLALVAQEPAMTLSGSLLGTPAYMAPEQVSGRTKVDCRTDVYSLGTVLYEMLTLRRPFEESGREEILAAILTREPAPPRRLNAKVPVDLETICLKAIEKDPDRRYATAQLLANDLRAYLSHRPLAARRAGLARRVTKWTRRHPVATIATAASVSLAIVAAIALQQGLRGSQAEVRGLVASAEVDIRDGTYRAGLEKVDRALALAPDHFEARKTRGRLLLGVRRNRELATLAAEILEERPEDWEAHGWLAFAGKEGGLPELFFVDNESGLADIPAEEHAKAVERLAPDSAEAWYVRGLAAPTATEALRCFDQALERDPGHAWALLARGQAHRDLCDFPAAIDDLQRAIAVRPRSPRGRRELARTYVLGYHDSERAMAELEKALAIDREDPLTYYERSWAYHTLHQDRVKRLADLARSVELAPWDSMLLAEEAGALNNLGRHEEALAQARRAVEIEPHRTRGHLEVLAALWGLGRKDELRTAMEDLRTRAHRWADRKATAEIYRGLSRHHLLLDETRQAISTATWAISLDPQNALGYRLRANARWRVEGQAAVEQECERIAALEPREPLPLLARTTCMHELCERTEEVFADGRRLIEMAPTWADSYSYLGDGYTIVGRHAEALPYHDKAVELAPTWSTGILGRARSHLGLRHWQQALADMERAFALGGEWTVSRWRQAIALAHLGREEEAIAATNRIVRMQPDLEFGYRCRSIIQFWFGRVEDAIASLDEAIAAQPSEWLPHGLRAVYSCYVQAPACSSIAEDARQAEALSDPDPYTWAFLAWFNAAHFWKPCPAHADLSRALELAERTLAASPRDREARYLATYAPGLALFRSGRYEESRIALAKGLVGDDGNDDEFVPALCTLAMSQWKLGRREEARASYVRALELSKDDLRKNPTHRRFLTEAASVLGLKGEVLP